MKFLHLNFIPRSTDLALLLLRLWAGGSMAILHGWMKASNFSTFSGRFMDPFGLGKPATLGLVIFAELVCATLLVFGIYTRFAALVLAFTMAMAFWLGHGAKLTGEGNGEMAFLFLGTFVTLFFAGAGKYSVDAKMGAKV